jgi:general secretion pathway protein G
MSPATLRRRTASRGFTLMEMLVTLSLLGLMAMLAAPLAEMTVQRQREQELRQALRDIRVALDRYRAASEQGLIERKVGDSGYPTELEVLVVGVPNLKSPARDRLYFLRRVPRDPFAPPDLEPASATWGLRSYASAPDAPSAGSDVFDVYSRAEGIGINGIPYRDW